MSRLSMMDGLRRMGYDSTEHIRTLLLSQDNFTMEECRLYARGIARLLFSLRVANWEMAEVVNVSRQTFSRWRRGESESNETASRFYEEVVWLLKVTLCKIEKSNPWPDHARPVITYDSDVEDEGCSCFATYKDCSEQDNADIASMTSEFKQVYGLH